MLPDRSLFIGQKLVGNAKIENIKYDILSNFKHCVQGGRARQQMRMVIADIFCLQYVANFEFSSRQKMRQYSITSPTSSIL